MACRHAKPGPHRQYRTHNIKQRYRQTPDAQHQTPETITATRLGANMFWRMETDPDQLGSRAIKASIGHTDRQKAANQNAGQPPSSPEAPWQAECASGMGHAVNLRISRDKLALSLMIARQGHEYKG
ncbi:hypothetical protein [Kushneria phyllosphaerae]|uniref:hypothetical protein n=1 Tax=Kushneria phyllosphaerae TaxID=2100822 RepID=UPI00140283B9|nr:hypothetical protein [Kushneria phyllosphaerae]